MLYPNELPHDPPIQEEWRTPDGTLGYAGYKVGDHVEEHELWGGGVYVYNRNDPDIVTENGFEVPFGKPGIDLIHLMTKNLGGPGTIDAVVDDTGTRSATSADTKALPLITRDTVALDTPAAFATSLMVVKPDSWSPTRTPAYGTPAPCIVPRRVTGSFVTLIPVTPRLRSRPSAAPSRTDGNERSDSPRRVGRAPDPPADTSPSSTKCVAKAPTERFSPRCPW